MYVPQTHAGAINFAYRNICFTLNDFSAALLLRVTAYVTHYTITINHGTDEEDEQKPDF
jgi:hypothetical protein